MTTSCDAVRHLAATLAYRAGKVLRDAPPGFAAMDAGPSARTPLQILAHMADLMTWAAGLTRGEHVWKADGGGGWEVEQARFFDQLSVLDRSLAAAAPPRDALEKLIQGPLADALTHVGQLALLRGMAGAAIRPESYARAEIVTGRVGPSQAAAVREFDGDASARKAD